ncbi:GerAB/ArcD/ProY family transporter [Heyndrickxia acidicola]|uniref:GerAB/ArcD/ProY family transporter n=1 Tax=Heyndrickxia acidicola TaxID=209389 RepID=A0ABU6MHS4_9BACI|nr:GerAB/ArcD/ProY family transporter [Heyndrickxia acidicola]MED1203556.1 GerAB/ArcD/ProY family transporter [Heyndrickxia acidicola]
MQPVPENRKISPFLLFFLMGNQVAVGVMGFQRILARTAGYDAWISIIIAGISTNLVMWFMYRLLEQSNGGDLNDSHFILFGKWFGGVLNLIWFVYFLAMTIGVLRSYIEVVQVWMFPDFKIFWFSLAFLSLCIYIIFGGFRTVTGIAFFAYILPFYIVIVLGLSLQFGDFHHLLPIGDHSMKDLFLASQNMAFTNLGFETLLFYYPFIKNPQKSKKWTHLGLITIMLIYVYIAVLSFAFFTPEQLVREIWATLDIFKIIHLPVVERFEYIAIANWCLIIMPIVCNYIWCATRILKRTFHCKQRLGVFLHCGVCLICIPLFTTRLQINSYLTFLGQVGFMLLYIYIPLLCLAIIIKNKFKKGKQSLS